MSRSNIILISITFFCLVLSGALFYQGLNGEFVKVNSSEVDNSQNYNEVLGEQTQTTATSTDSAEIEFPGDKATVLKVVDGDTIEVSLNNQVFNLRYIGVDTPETVDPRRPVGCFGKEASDENKRLLTGKTVYLEKDISEADKYGRILRYVYLPLDDGTLLFVNDYLVRQGFAKSSTYPPDVKHQERFNQAQSEARDNNRGLWGTC